MKTQRNNTEKAPDKKAVNISDFDKAWNKMALKLAEKSLRLPGAKLRGSPESNVDR